MSRRTDNPASRFKVDVKTKQNKESAALNRIFDKTSNRAGSAREKSSQKGRLAKDNKGAFDVERSWVSLVAYHRASA